MTARIDPSADRPCRRRIIVAPTPTTVGLGRLFRSTRELSGNTAPRVDSLDAACAALGEIDRDVEPIDFDR